MSISLVKMLGRFLGLIVVTIFAIAVAIASNWGTKNPKTPPTVDANPAESAATVSVQHLELQDIEITLTSSGMIEPRERHTVSAEIAGRIIELGTNGQGEILDEGDRVTKGDLIVRLDDRVLKARVAETSARLKQAQNDHERLDRLRINNPSVITKADFQKSETDVAVAATMATVAQTNLEDATIVAPATGVISRRMINDGESVRPADPLFEIIEVDDVILRVGVPEFQISELIDRRQKVRQTGEVFRAFVHLLGKKLYGRTWPVLKGEVHHISETADDKTGLFEVEILLKKDEKQGVRPGQIALAHIVVDHVTGYKLPVAAAIYRDDNAYIYSVSPEAPAEGMSTTSSQNTSEQESSPNPLFRANKIKLAEYVEQGSDLIIPEGNLAPKDLTVIVRGQHRVVDGRLVEIVPNNSGPSVEHE